MSSRRLPTYEHPPADADHVRPPMPSTAPEFGEPGRLGPPPTWTCASEAVEVCLFPPNRRRVTAIALLVGSLLVAINQGGALASGRVSWILWVRMALDYLIPACVSTMGVLAGSRRTGATPRRGVD